MRRGGFLMHAGPGASTRRAASAAVSGCSYGCADDAGPNASAALEIADGGRGKRVRARDLRWLEVGRRAGSRVLRTAFPLPRPAGGSLLEARAGAARARAGAHASRAPRGPQTFDGAPGSEFAARADARTSQSQAVQRTQWAPPPPRPGVDLGGRHTGKGAAVRGARPPSRTGPADGSPSASLVCGSPPPLPSGARTRSGADGAHRAVATGARPNARRRGSAGSAPSRARWADVCEYVYGSIEEAGGVRIRARIGIWARRI